MAQEPGGESPKPPEGQSISRRGFLRDAALAAGGAAVGGGLVSAFSGRGSEQAGAPQDIIKPDQLTQEQREVLQERVWGGLTHVLQEGLFSKDSLKVETITQISPQKGGLLHQEREAQTRIEGSVRGNSRQAGVHFSINFKEAPVTPEEEVKLDVSTESGEVKHIILGEQKGQVLEIGYFTGENAGDVTRPSPRKGVQIEYPVAMDPESMKKRFEDMVDVLKNHLKIPQDAPFIPGPDFNGLATFINNRTGYGVYINSVKGIDGKSVTFKVNEGLSTEEAPWRDIDLRASGWTYSTILRPPPHQISFQEVLRGTLISLNHSSNKTIWEHNHPMKEAPATEYINNLAKQYLPAEMVGEAKRG